MLGMVVHACNPSTREVEAGGNKLKASLGYSGTLSKRKKKRCAL
jgi:hypothetical protein